MLCIVVAAARSGITVTMHLVQWVESVIWVLFREFVVTFILISFSCLSAINKMVYSRMSTKKSNKQMCREHKQISNDFSYQIFLHHLELMCNEFVLRFLSLFMRFCAHTHTITFIFIVIVILLFFFL